MYVDSHCHLSHEQFRADLGTVLAAAASAGVTQVVSIASHLADAEWIGDHLLGSRGAPVAVYGTAGIHPHEVGALSRDPGAVGETLARLRSLCSVQGVVAVGECGLDFFYDFAPSEAQFFWFEAQLQMAASLDLPVVVHCRDAEAAMIPRVREAGEAGVRGVLHCFPGDLALLDTALDAGWCVSFTGNVSFRNFSGTEAVRVVPQDRYFLETDGPYLAPVPFRGKRNTPAHVPLIAEHVARLRGETVDRVAMDSTAAATRFFRLSAQPS
jgi:TatD DNase family protein